MSNQNNIQQESMLRVGTVLRGIYRIDGYLSSGGFGNTYVATNIEFNERYAIKEFFMKGVTHREGDSTSVSVSNSINKDSFLQQKEKFKKEARRLRQLNNPHIVRVHDLFEENGTAYYVMDFVDGENLSERLKRTGKPMDDQEVRAILPQILDALKSVHDAGIWHLDLKPANIMLDKAGNVKLIDFGASKQMNAQKGGATTSTAITYTNGYAPREQMEQNYDKFGPWTDIYALGATLYNLLTNMRPPLPSDIDDDITADKHESLPFPESVSGLRFLVLQMLKTGRLQRPQNIEAIMEIESSKKEEPVQAPKLQPALQPTADYGDEMTVIIGTKYEEQEEDVTPQQKINPQVTPKIKNGDKSNIINFEENNKFFGDGRILGSVFLIAVFLVFFIFSQINIISCNHDISPSTSPEVIDSIDEKKNEIVAREAKKNEIATEKTIAKKQNNKQIVENNTGISLAFLNEFIYMEGGTVSKRTIRSFWISEKPVNLELWIEIMQYNPSNNQDNHSPVVNISWYECQNFVKKLNKRTGLSFRMPTNDEWTFASTRGIKGNISEWTTSSHCFSDNNGYGKYSITRNLAYKEQMNATRVLSIKEKDLGFRLALDNK